MPPGLQKLATEFIEKGLLSPAPTYLGSWVRLLGLTKLSSQNSRITLRMRCNAHQKLRCYLKLEATLRLAK